MQLPRRNILIFHNAALGDFLMTWPLAMALGRVLAQSRIIYVTASHKGQLAERVIGVEFNDAENGWHALHAPDAKLPEKPLKLVQSMQFGVVFAQQPESVMLENLQRLSGNQPVLPIIPNPLEDMHVWKFQLAQLAYWPMLQDAVEQVQGVIRKQGVLKQTEAASDAPVVIHPGSGAERKNWPIERFIEVAKLLKKSVVFTLGEVERERLGDAVIGKLREVGTVKSCETTLQLFDTLSAASAYIGNDSGPTHLAAMLGKPTTALFGPTSNAQAWGPVGPRVTILPFETSPADVARAID